MGPTPAAPLPRSCPACARDASPREIQSAYARLLHGMDECELLVKRLHMLDAATALAAMSPRADLRNILAS